MQSVYLRSALSFLILVSTVGACLGQANQTCQHTGLVTPVFNFSIDSYLGTWYGQKVYSGLPENAWPLEYRCLEVEYNRYQSTFLPFTSEERFITFPNGTDIRNTALGYGHLSEKSDAIWNLVGFYNGELMEGDSVIVQTDYENWTIQFVCKVEDNYRYETMHILTRDRNPDPELLDLLEIIVKNYGFPSENGRTVVQTNC